MVYVGHYSCILGPGRVIASVRLSWMKNNSIAIVPNSMLLLKSKVLVLESTLAHECLQLPPLA